MKSSGPAPARIEQRQFAASGGSLWRKALLVVLFVVLLTDLVPGLGVGLAPGLSGKNLLLYIVVIMISVRAASAPSGIRFSDLDVHVPFLLLIAYATITIIIASAFSPTYNIFRGVITLKNQLVDLYLFMFAFRYSIERQKDYLGILRFVVVTMLILSLVTLVDYLDIPDLGLVGLHHGRIEGPFGDANQYGALLAFLLPVSIAFARSEQRRWYKSMWWAGIFVTLVLLLGTGSRAAFVSLFAGAVIGAIVLRRHLDLRQVAGYTGLAILVLIVGLALLLSINSEIILERVDRTTSGNIYTASSGRVGIWTAAIMVMLEWPLSFLVGYGWNAYESSGIWKSAHNEYLDRWYELGVLGLLIFVALLRAILIRARRWLAAAEVHVRRILIGYTFSISIIIVDIFFVGLPQSWAIIWIVTGLVMGLESAPGAVSVTSNRRPKY